MNLEDKLRLSIDYARARRQQRAETTEYPMPEETPHPSTALTTLTHKPPMFALTVSTFEDGWRLAKVLTSSSLCPEAYRGKPEDAFVAMQFGSEVGLGPMAALQGIAVIGGRACLWGDAMLALVQAHPHCEDILEIPANADNNWTARCIVKRYGRSSPVERAFSKADAMRAQLWMNPRKTPWCQYPERMLQMRARSWALRDSFADALRGVQMAEEQRDAVRAEVVSHKRLEDSPPVSSKAPEAPEPDSVPAPPAVRLVPPVLVQPEPPSTSPDAFLVRNGKNAGKRLGELSGAALEWYAGSSKDPLLRDKAQAVLDRRVQAMALGEREMEQAHVPYDPETGEVLEARS